jgi:hypothetical protein
MSFQRATDREGYRYSLTHRTRKCGKGDGGYDGLWMVERWSGGGWAYVGAVGSYAAARALATWNQEANEYKGAAR